MRPRPMALVILDGWGLAADHPFNAICQARTPHFDQWLSARPHARVFTSGLDVGLPEGQMGNSEVGHLNIGAGRVVYQDYTRIDQAVADGSFFKNEALLAALEAARRSGGAVHILGLLSPGGVHSHQGQMLAAVRASLAAGVKAVFVHAFLDGRDTPPRSALGYLAEFEQGLLPGARVATVCGRFFAMDRDKRWDRVERAYDLLTLGEGVVAPSAQAAVELAYARGEDDEFVQPTVVAQAGEGPVVIGDGDAILVMNFRADRVREIAHAFTDGDGFAGFTRKRRPALSAFVCLTEYDQTLQNVTVAFPPESLNDILGEIFSREGLVQVRAAETEKYAHVTFFLNGGREAPFAGEERILVPSPQVATYDASPEMSAQALTDAVVARLGQGGVDVLVINYANPDMVGHTGSLEAAIKAIEAVDAAVGRLVGVILAAGGELLITADHGNAEQMREEATGQPHTAHTTNPVPLIYLGSRALSLEDGRLCDLAPTLLTLMALPVPQGMSGRSLVTW